MYINMHYWTIPQLEHACNLLLIMQDSESGTAAGSCWRLKYPFGLPPGALLLDALSCLLSLIPPL